MAQQDDRFTRVIAAIDAANALDPNRIDAGGQSQPAELVYGQRMTGTMMRMCPGASEPLRIAVRGQHIERWKLPRTAHPAGRAGYLQWRREQREHQAARLASLMSAEGYAPAEIARVGALIRKENMKSDPDVQMLEDIICVTFLQYYLSGFSTKVEQDKLAGILAKTWNRMSEFGHQHARQLGLPAPVHQLLDRGLAQLKAKG